MANRCPSCGGTLRFDIQKQKLVCEYCESEFDPSSIQEMTGAGESEAFGNEPVEEPEGETIDAKIFTCPNCGAEVFATDLDAVEYCSYCGTFVTLESRLAKMQKPSYIVPFTITKEKCMELYGEKLKKTHFLPKDMKVENAESKLHNTYIPFWVYTEKMDAGAELHFTGLEEWSRGNTDYKQEYFFDTHPEGTVEGVFFDASATLDDRISEQIGNFPMDSLQPYNSSLMTGSYADVADVKKEVYVDNVRQKGVEAIAEKMKQDFCEGDRFVETFHDTTKVKSIALKKDDNTYSSVDAKLAMLPVWFMTWKNKNRLCYSVINGNTGKMFTEIPADIKKYSLASFLIAIPIFILLELFLTLMPKTLIYVSAALSLIFLFLRRGALKKLKRQDERMDDKGFQNSFGNETPSDNSKNKGKVKGGLPFWISIVGLVASAFLIYKSFPDDIINYACVIFNIVATFISIASMVKAHNLSCSRPIPHFFDERKGA